MKRTESELGYFFWLARKIRLKDHKEFRQLLTRLNSLSFYSTIDFDDNRALDGLAYRDSYKRETHIEPPDGDCSVLEVLIAIAERMSYILYDPDLENEDQIHIWFWRLMNNLHLDPMYNYLEDMGHIHVWLSRSYAENGDGGLFPLKDPIEDQRKVEIWYQMQAYINEILF